MNWKKLFAIHIFERGYDYYFENAVENLDISEIGGEECNYI